MMQRLDLRKLTIIYLAFMLFGCASGNIYHLYEGSLRTPSEVAAIKPWLEKDYASFRILNVWPASIDGKPTEPYSGGLPSYLVLPGEHRIVIGFNWLDLMQKTKVAGEDPVEMSFVAKAGHIYTTKASMPIKMSDDTIRIGFWIEDGDTGEIVAGSRLLTNE